MDKLEYIPGDLVMTNGVPCGTAKDVVYRVTSSDPSKTLKLDDGTVLKSVVCLENIEGAEVGDKVIYSVTAVLGLRILFRFLLLRKFYARINGKHMLLTMITASMISYTFVRSQQIKKQAVLN